MSPADIARLRALWIDDDPSADAVMTRNEALCNAGDDLLDAAEYVALLGEVRRLTGDPVVYLCPVFADLSCSARKWVVVSDRSRQLGSGPTELDALRDALARLGGGECGCVWRG